MQLGINGGWIRNFVEVLFCVAVLVSWVFLFGFFPAGFFPLVVEVFSSGFFPWGHVASGSSIFVFVVGPQLLYAFCMFGGHLCVQLCSCFM